MTTTNDNLLKMRLQFFAEDPEPADDPDGNEPDGNDGGGEVTIESLMAENARLKVDSAKNKTALDKALKNVGELTKQLRAKMTVSEQEEQARKDEEDRRLAELNDLKEFKRKAEAKERYLTIGMNAEFAKLAAEAEVKGDMDAFADVMKRYNDASIKEQKDEWIRSRPDINSGHGDDEDEMAALEKQVASAMGNS